MVDDVGEYQWSSYRHNAYGEHDPLVTPYVLYDALGATPPVRRTAYRALFRHAIAPTALETIRVAANRGTALGDTSFVQQLESSTKRRVARYPHGGDRKSQMYRLIETF
jgi:putative transposase